MESESESETKSESSLSSESENPKLQLALKLAVAWWWYLWLMVFFAGAAIFFGMTWRERQRWQAVKRWQTSQWNDGRGEIPSSSSSSYGNYNGFANSDAIRDPGFDPTNDPRPAPYRDYCSDDDEEGRYHDDDFMSSAGGQNAIRSRDNGRINFVLQAAATGDAGNKDRADNDDDYDDDGVVVDEEAAASASLLGHMD